jgi:hypothetical protein
LAILRPIHFLTELLFNEEASGNHFITWHLFLTYKPSCRINGVSCNNYNYQYHQSGSNKLFMIHQLELESRSRVITACVSMSETKYLIDKNMCMFVVMVHL